MKCYYRTVRDNRIRLLGRRIHCKNLKKGELDGQRLCFIPYAGKVKPSFSTTGLTALWGTEKVSRALNAGCSEEEMKTLLKEEKQILAPSGSYNWYFWEEESTCGNLGSDYSPR